MLNFGGLSSSRLSKNRCQYEDRNGVGCESLVTSTEKRQNATESPASYKLYVVVPSYFSVAVEET